MELVVITSITSILVVLLLTLVGVESVIARIISTIVISLVAIRFFMSLFDYVTLIFDKDSYNDDCINITRLLDLLVSSLLIGTLTFMLTWVWGQDLFFTEVGDWSETTPLESFVYHLYTCVHFSGGAVSSVHLPKIPVSFFIMLSYALFFNFMWSLLIQFAMTTAMENINKRALSYNDNSKDHRIIDNKTDEKRLNFHFNTH